MLKSTALRTSCVTTCNKHTRSVALGLRSRHNLSVCAIGSPALERQIQDKQEYRRNVGVCVINTEGLVFAARRVDDTQGTWQMPQGGIDALENPMVAAFRELQEETGMTSVQFLAQVDRWLDYDFPTEVKHHFTGDWVRYKGQTQKWFLFHFYGSESEINLDRDGDPEFLDYQWMPLEQLPRGVVPFKRRVYEQVALEFCPRIEKWLQERKMQGM